MRDTDRERVERYQQSVSLLLDKARRECRVLMEESEKEINAMLKETQDEFDRLKSLEYKEFSNNEEKLVLKDLNDHKDATWGTIQAFLHERLAIKFEFANRIGLKEDEITKQHLDITENAFELTRGDKIIQKKRTLN